MKAQGASKLGAAWARHDAKWRDVAQVTSQWCRASEVEPALLHYESKRRFFELLSTLRITLLLTREYEHLIVALSAKRGRPRMSFFPVPHPSGLVVDRAKRELFVASTRNPNQLFVFKPVCGLLPRRDAPRADVRDNPLVPVRSIFFPGCLYLHDLAFVGGRLHGNSVGQNAVVRLDGNGSHKYVWWPKSIETKGRPRFGRNYLQLNSIAAAKSLSQSYFSASCAKPGRHHPGDRDYPVDGRGVIFSGRTREPICDGLTRPHSARLSEGALWVANSGYGEVVRVGQAGKETVARLPGWTRGLCFVKGVVFVATSRVIPRYAHYAPGVRVAESLCGVHAIEAKSGKSLGAITWPVGNQIFAIDWIADEQTLGFPFSTPRDFERDRLLFYSFQHDNSMESSE